MRNFYRNPYYRSNNIPPSQQPLANLPPVCPPPKPPPPLKSHHCKGKKTPKKKLNLKSLKKDTCSSLNDVENFLCDFNIFLKYIKLYKLLK